MSEIKNKENKNKEKKQYKKFSEYYQDPEFKKKHKEYMAEHVECACGAKTARNNMPRHQKTQKHLKAMWKLVMVDPDIDLNSL